MDDPNTTTAAETPGSGSLGSVLDVITSLGAAANQTAGTVLSLQQQRDTLAGAREDRQFQNYLKSSELDLAKSKVTIGNQVELLKAQGVLEQTRAALASASIPWGTILIVGALSAGGFLLFRAMRGRA